MAELGRTLALALAYCAVFVTTAEARVQDYQVVRLISYHTSCDLAHLEDRSPARGPMRFFATCTDLTFYPDGLEVVCDDRDDDRSCHVLTPERSFRNLELLIPKR